MSEKVAGIIAYIVIFGFMIWGFGIWGTVLALIVGFTMAWIWLEYDKRKAREEERVSTLVHRINELEQKVDELFEKNSDDD